ncbi:unnamed protein product [Allacma fusca]|uniref:Uncharacterized protein n=1 Tax=Allacma fusca TaxID=39272 RepID=A0A8J2JUC0_9HEXA|nr:unnamed protein product [Allacma fusca]
MSMLVTTIGSNKTGKNNGQCKLQKRITPVTFMTAVRTGFCSEVFECDTHSSFYIRFWRTPSFRLTSTNLMELQLANYF